MGGNQSDELPLPPLSIDCIQAEAVTQDFQQKMCVCVRVCVYINFAIFQAVEFKTHK